MELEQFTQLYERIQIDRSVLILGQQYLSMGGERDAVWQKISQELFPDLSLSRRKADYPSLWNQAVTTSADATVVMEKVISAGRECLSNRAVEAVLKLRWSLLYTSSIDNAEIWAIPNGYTPVPYEERNSKPKYMNKEMRYRVDLCGNRDCPPILNDRIKKKSFLRQIETKVSWISNSYLEYYGVLVIDGFDPEYDWLNDENLFGQLTDMPLNSIFWFGAPEEIGENAEMLVQQGILSIEGEGFFEHLQRHMSEILDDDNATSMQESDLALYTPLTLKLGDNQTYTVYISRADISNITGNNLCVMDDDILADTVLYEKSRAERFAAFLGQDELPNWHLFSTKKDELPFYVPRDLDGVLETRLYEAMKETGLARNPIILSGPSNSGKSMMLANLALTIAKRRKCPVIFIRGELLNGAYKRLSDFIGNWFGNTERYGGERIGKVIVIWDGSGLKRTDRDYDTLQRLLSKYNVQVVGSTYTSLASSSINLGQNLSVKEHQRLQNVLSSLGSSYNDRFNEIIRVRERVKSLKNTSLLYLLQALFKYEFDEEYKSLSKILARQFDQERIYAEQEAGRSLQSYVENFFETQKKIVQDGVASSFQEKLKLALAKITIQEHESSSTTDTKVNEQIEKLKKLKQLSECIEEMNGILAVASEFGVQLPLHLLLKFLRDRRGNAYVTYNEETAKIIDILRADTLIQFTYKTDYKFGEEYYVSFRNSMEAENYICLMCGLPLEDRSKTRKATEISILKKIIQSADSDIDLWSVIELVRQFGPNGHGMLSELGVMRSKKDYTEYSDYWLELADTIVECFPDDPEAILLYAHLTREYIALASTEHRAYFQENYVKVRTRLESALKRMEENNQDEKDQYARLSVELCANYQQAMRENGYNAVTHNEIKKRVREAFRKSKRQDAKELRKDFSSNSLLDILINAYLVYKDLAESSEQERKELAQIVCDIDDMLNLDDLAYEMRAQDLFRKIKSIYEELGNDSSEMVALQQKLSAMNSDAFLYLQARMMWHPKNKEHLDTYSETNSSFIYNDFYALVCRDVPYRNLVMSEGLYLATREAAESVTEFLIANDDIIRKTRSERCITMLLRAKWFQKTGKPMLGSKQMVSLTRTEWEEIISLCDRYHSYHEPEHEAFIPAYFLKGVYEWIYGNPAYARDWFAKARDNARFDTSNVIEERMVLCVEGTQIPRTFQLSVQKLDANRSEARVLKETTLVSGGADAVSNRYGIRVSPRVLEYLFDGTPPREQYQQARKEGVIRFNLYGAQIGIPQTGGYGNEQ